MNDEKIEPQEEIGDRQHVNPDGETDALKGARLGGIGGAITGGVAGSTAGPLGTLAGAVIGGVVGAVASGAAVALVDTMDGDSATDNPRADFSEYDLSEPPAYWDNRTDLPERRYDADAPESRRDLPPLRR